MAQSAVIRFPTTGNARTDAAFEALAGILTQILDRLDSIEAGQQTIRKDIADLQQDVATVRKDVTDLQNDVATIRNDLADVKTDVASLKTDVAGLRTDVADVKTEVTSLQDGQIELFDKFFGR
jgi:chromosome segregation ATPase